MDKYTDDGRLTPIEFIKRAHEMKRAEILDNMTDEIELGGEIVPAQVGLHPVLADDNGQFWVVVRQESGQLILKRICDH